VSFGTESLSDGEKFVHDIHEAEILCWFRDEMCRFLDGTDIGG
jgi:hypothetical protein